MCFAVEAGPLHLGDTRSAEAVHPMAGQITDLDLDRYHTKLLHSNDPVENLLGTISTVFWGFYTFGPRFAMIRATRHRDGYRGKQASTPEHVAECLRACTSEDLGAALGQLGGLSQLGRTPFASKVIALMYPEKAGVLDNKIADALAVSSWAEGAPFQKGIGDVRELRYQHRYAAWCDFLSTISGRLNVGIDDGAAWHWGKGSTRPQRWRAIDVERALFAYFSD